MISENKLLPNRKRARLKGFDYSSPGAYFVTICTKDKKCILSHITVGQGLAPAEKELVAATLEIADFAIIFSFFTEIFIRRFKG